MKTTIVILNTEEWNFKTEDGKELQGISAIYLLEDYELQRTTVKDDLLNTVQKTKLPALFEVDLKPVQKYNKGKAQLKYEIHSLKFIKELQIFNKA